MGDWKSEDDIKAELRELTSELRKVREELRGMVQPAPKKSSTRAFLHKHSWSPHSSAHANDRRPRVNDRRARRSRKSERG